MLQRAPEVWIAEGSLSAMVRFATSLLPDETGGVLLGYWRADGQTVVVTHVLGPGPQAKHGPAFFEPDYTYHLGEVERIYEASGRIATYLGDWHSHPHGSDHLSFEDRRTLRRIATAPDARAPKPLMGILADERQWRLRVWARCRALSWTAWPHRYETAKLRITSYPAHVGDNPKVEAKREP